MIEQYTGQEIETGIVRFTADWCVPCRTFQPVFDNVGANSDVPFYAIDIEQYMDVAQAQGVMSIPAVFAVRNGNWSKFAGVPSGQELAVTAAQLDKPDTE